MRHRCRPPSLYGVQDVLTLRDPLQVLQVVVEPIAVLVVDHQPRMSAQKRLSHKAMNITTGFAGSIVAEVDPLVSPVFIGFQQPRTKTAKQPFHLSFGADDVSVLKADDW